MPDLSVRLKLAAVWTALMFLFVYADLLSFFRPGELAEISAGNMGPVDVSQGSLLIAAVIVTIPALMIAISAAAPFPPGPLAQPRSGRPLHPRQCQQPDR
jgi:hypothetical protein